MYLLILHLTYMQVRILNLCLVLGFIFGIFAVYAFIEQKLMEKHAQTEIKACERKRKRLQQAIEQKQFDDVYKSVMLDDIFRQTKYEYSLCQLCNNKCSSECRCTGVKEVFVDDLGNVVGCSKYSSGVRAKK